MLREEAVAVAARTLINRRGFSIPENIENLLSLYSDEHDISDWARGTVALAAREGIIGMGGNFAPLRDITRDEAAIIMHRLFMLLHETSPTVIEMTPITFSDDGEIISTMAIARSDNLNGEVASASSFPIAPVIISGIGGMALVGGFWIVYSLGKKHAKHKDSE